MEEIYRRLYNAMGARTVLRMAAEDPRPGHEPLTARARDYLAELQPALDSLDAMQLRVVQVRYLAGIYGRCVPWPAVALQIYGKDGPAQIKAAQRLHRSALDALSLYWGLPDSGAGTRKKRTL